MRGSHCQDERQAGKLTLTSRAFHNDQLAPFYEEIAEHDRLPQGAANEQRRRGGGERDQIGAQMGLRGKRCTGWAGRDHRLRRQFSRTHSWHRGLQHRPISTRAFRTVRAPGFRIIPFGDARALEAAFTPNTVAFLVEPIQGEAGVIIPPPGYFAKVRELCTAHDVMLILDEIQTGLGRTGKLLAEQHDGIEADVTLLGKALSGGLYPVSAVISNNAVLGTLKPGQHGSTFGGNPLACAVARAALRVLVEEGMIENAAVQGARFLQGLRSLRANTIREVRGRGLMLAVELHPEAGAARRYCEALQTRGILAKDTHEHTIRIAPPLVVTSDQVDWALGEDRSYVQAVLASFEPSQARYASKGARF